MKPPWLDLVAIQRSIIGRPLQRNDSARAGFMGQGRAPRPLVAPPPTTRRRRPRARPQRRRKAPSAASAQLSYPPPRRTRLSPLNV